MIQSTNKIMSLLKLNLLFTVCFAQSMNNMPPLAKIFEKCLPNENPEACLWALKQHLNLDGYNNGNSPISDITNQIWNQQRVFRESKRSLKQDLNPNKLRFVRNSFNNSQINLKTLRSILKELLLMGQNPSKIENEDEAYYIYWNTMDEDIAKKYQKQVTLTQDGIPVPLILAKNDMESFKLLLSFGANINDYAGQNKKTVLMWAAQLGLLEQTLLLLYLGADKNAKTYNPFDSEGKESKTALQLCKEVKVRNDKEKSIRLQSIINYLSMDEKTFLESLTPEMIAEFYPIKLARYRLDKIITKDNYEHSLEIYPDINMIYNNK